MFDTRDSIGRHPEWNEGSGLGKKLENLHFAAPSASLRAKGYFRSE